MNIPISTPKESDNYHLLVSKSALLTGNNSEARRAEIKKYFFTLYEKLFDCLASTITI